MVEESLFIQNLNEEITLIKNIISSPKLVQERFTQLKNTNTNLKERIQQYKFSSENAIKNDIMNMIEPVLEGYQQRAKQEYKTAEIVNTVKIPKLEQLDYDIDVPNDNIYDDLLQQVDLSIPANGKLSKSQIKTIKMYTEVKNEIIDELDEMVDSIKNFEQQMVNRRKEIYDNLVNCIVPKLYKTHLSYMRSTLMKKNSVTNVIINDTMYTVSSKQSVFLKSAIKKYLFN